MLLNVLRGASDFDRDGYSSLWMGGDCAPFDKRVHPGSIEIPGDGIDNNCIGGDGSGVVKIEPPQFRSKPSHIPERPNILLITVETLRADRVSFLGYERPTTPQLAEFVKDAYVFDNFFATTPWTRLSLPAILSSRPPTLMRWRREPGKHPSLPADLPWIPTLFQQGGYDTIAVLPALSAFTHVESIGFERGFNTYDTSSKSSSRGGTLRGFPGREQAKVVRNLLERRQTAKSFFLWMHLLEPHYMYERSDRAPDFGSDKQGLYASEIWEMDAVVGTVLRDLKRLGLHDNTVVVLVGDHGEEFQEHGQNWHGGSLYQTQLHTAALMRVPGLLGGRISQAVSHEDVGPTLLNLAGIRQGFDRLGGRNLMTLFASERLARDHFFVERFEIRNGTKFMAAVVHYPYKLIYTEDGQRYELFDLARDPAEKHPLPLRGAQFETLQQQLRLHVDGAQR